MSHGRSQARRLNCARGWKEAIHLQSISICPMQIGGVSILQNWAQASRTGRSPECLVGYAGTSSEEEQYLRGMLIGIWLRTSSNPNPAKGLNLC